MAKKIREDEEFDDLENEFDDESTDEVAPDNSDDSDDDSDSSIDDEISISDDEDDNLDIIIEIDEDFEEVTSLEEGLAKLDKAKKDGIARSFGLVANIAEILPEILKKNIRIDVLTDQTSAHDPLVGYIPTGMFRQTIPIVQCPIYGVTTE